MFSRRLELVVTLASVMATGAVADDSLYPQPLLPMLVEPVGVIAVDLDEDGLLDLVSANAISGDIAVLLGNGDGTFAADARFEACGGLPDGPTFTATGDFDENGTVDLAVTCSFTDFVSISVLLGNGDGTFGSSVEYGDGEEDWFQVQTGDFNNDDHLDLITAHYPSSDSVSLYLGNGDGTFGPELDLGGNDHGVAVGDFNGDDNDDYVTGNLRVYLGNGDGTFEPPLIFPGSGLHVIAVDLDGDTILDLAAVDNNANELSVLLGIGDGTFAPRQVYPTGDQANFVAAADFNGDQLVDLAVNNRASKPGISVFLGTGGGLFAPAVGVDPVRIGADSMAVGDFNLDGAVDIVRPCYWCDDLAVIFGDGSGGFTTSLGEGVGSQPSDVVAADLDGDGRPDFAATNENSDDVSVILSDATATYEPEVRYLTRRGPSAIVTGEFSGDSIPDLVTSNRSHNNLSLLTGTGGGGFASTIGPAVGTAPSDLAVGDFNEDDHDDLVVTNEGSNDLSVLLGQGDGTFISQPVVPVGTAPTSIVVADLDGDEHDDLAVTNGGSHDVSVLLGTGSGSFAAAAGVPVGLLPTALAVGDLDGDDRTDLAVVHTGSDDLRTYLGNGDGSFTAAQIIDLPDRTGSWASFPDPLALIVTDMNDDGLLDVGVGTRVRMEVLLNTGGGVLESEADSAYAIYGRATGIAGADVNGDALQDLVVANSASQDLTILVNQLGPDHLSISSDKSTLVWPAVIGALSYNVYRGNLDALVDTDEDGLPDGGYGFCMTALDNDSTDTFFDDPDIPAAEEGFFYLRSVVDAGGESGLGTTSAGLPRVPAVVCP